MFFELAVTVGACMVGFTLYYLAFSSHPRMHRRLFNAFSLWHDPTPIQKRVLFQFTALSLASERRNARKTVKARRELRQCPSMGRRVNCRQSAIG